MKPVLRNFVLVGCFVGAGSGFAGAAAAQTVSTTTLSSAANPSLVFQAFAVTATVSTAGPGGTVSFYNGGLSVPGCSNLPVSQVDFATVRATCQVEFLTEGVYPIRADYSGNPNSSASSASLDQHVVRPSLGTATVFNNPTGNFTVQGASVNGNVLSNFGDHVVITLGPGGLGIPGPFLLVFDTFRLGPGQTFAINGLGGHQVQILVSGSRAVVAGTVTMDHGYLDFVTPAGLTLYGGIRAEHLFVNALAGDWHGQGSIFNAGALDGGFNLQLYASSFAGDGAYAGNAIDLHTWGNANNPVHGAHYLANGLNLYPSSQVTGGSPPSTSFSVMINAYGTQPQVVNLKLHGDASVWMPRDSGTGSIYPANNAVVPPDGSRAPGVPDPAYGGGSMILYATGALSFFDGPVGSSLEFTFPGALVLKSDVAIDVQNVRLNQGWTTTGRSFQGTFLEAPLITNSRPGGTIDVYSNDLNWINFSTLPAKSVRAFRLTRNGDGSASYAAADGVATHLNTYSLVTETAANGGCWTCVVNTTAVDMTNLQ